MYPTRHSLLLILVALVAPSCGGGGGTGGGGEFVVLGTEPLNNGTLFLNEPIAIDFSTPVREPAKDQ